MSAVFGASLSVREPSANFHPSLHLLFLAHELISTSTSTPSIRPFLSASVFGFLLQIIPYSIQSHV